jgi:TPR repeat protein
MICRSYLDLKSCLKNYKTNYFSASMLVNTYKEGNPNLKVNKDLKKAIKVLLYWEKHHDVEKYYYFIYGELEKIYKELKNSKKANFYRYKYNLLMVKKRENPSNLLGYYARNTIEYEIENGLSFKGKVINKKLVESFIKNYKVFLEYETSNYSITEFKYNNRLIELFNSSKYQKLYLVHFLKKSYLDKTGNSLVLLKKFKKEDFLSYLEILNYPTLSFLKDFKNFLKTYYEYHFENCSDDVKLEYAKYLCSKTSYIESNYKEALTIAKSCYEKGNIKASRIIYDIYLNNVVNQSLHFIKKHAEKYKDNKEEQLWFADELFKKFYNINTGSNKKGNIKEAIKIYEKYHKSLSDKQLDILSNVYAKGHEVEIDLEKAKLYSRTNDEEVRKAIKKNELKVFNKLVLKYPSFKKMINDLKDGVEKNDVEKIIKFIDIIGYGYIVEQDLELIKILIKILEDLNHPHGYYLQYMNYKFGEFDEQNLNLSKEYYNKLINTSYSDFVKYLEEENDKYLQKAYESGLYLAKVEYSNHIKNTDEKKYYQIQKELFESGYYYHSIMFPFDYYNQKYNEVDKKQAYEYFKKLSDETNYPKSCYYVYLLSKELKILKPKDEISYLLRSADNGFEKAIYKMAEIYYQGDNKAQINIDYKKAFDLYSSIDEYKPVWYRLGECYYYGNGVTQNYKKAFEYFSKSYDYNKESIIYIADCYRYGRGVKKDFNIAFKYFEEASKKGGFYLYRLARLYLFGEEGYIEVDSNKALKMLLEAEKTYKDNNVYFSIGYAYNDLKDYKNAIKYYKKSLKDDEDAKSAYFNMGLIYSTNDFVDKDYKEAMTCFEQSYKLGLDDAAYRLGCMYAYNLYGMVDDKKAEIYLKKAYDKKVKNADITLAYIYEHQDNEKDAYECIKDSTSEHFLRYVTLGNLYYSGKYLNRDYNLAFNNFQKAYELNNTDPYIWFRLGRCYYFGHGVERDLNRAYDFINLAKNDGFNDAIYFYDEYFKNKN